MHTTRTLENISDGKIYDVEDMVAADAGGCNGCSACCHNVGDLVALTPFDAYELVNHLNISFDSLLGDKLELHEENKILLPHLKMQGATKRCSFLNAAGRCEIHSARPNICRLFPLGRVYEKDDFKYFLQVGNCMKPKLEMVQVRQWIGINNYEANKAMILSWHQFIKALAFRLKFIRDAKELEEINTYILDNFYRITIEENQDFYTAFTKQLVQAKSHLGII
nr:YkgJ family cysteine cluster protein [uncultured Cellulosilyticum sp.]